MDCTALHLAIAQLARILASEPWAEEEKVFRALSKELKQVREEFHRHMTWAEKPGGLLHTLAEECPRLCNDIGRLGCEHRLIAQHLEELERCLKAFNVTHPSTARPVRHAAKALVTAMDQHQTHGHEVVLGVYSSDLGMGE